MKNPRHFNPGLMGLRICTEDGCAYCFRGQCFRRRVTKYEGVCEDKVIPTPDMTFKSTRDYDRDFCGGRWYYTVAGSNRYILNGDEVPHDVFMHALKRAYPMYL